MLQRAATTSSGPTHAKTAPAPEKIEQVALRDDYFIEKKLHPNVDFYSGAILSAIGFPTSMFTALFALARTVGRVAQWNEMIADPDQKIGRPSRTAAGRQVCPITHAQLQSFGESDSDVPCGGVRVSIRETGARISSPESDSSSAPATLSATQSGVTGTLDGSWGCAC